MVKSVYRWFWTSSVESFLFQNSKTTLNKIFTPMKKECSSSKPSYSQSIWVLKKRKKNSFKIYFFPTNIPIFYFSPCKNQNFVFHPCNVQTVCFLFSPWNSIKKCWRGKRKSIWQCHSGIVSPAVMYWLYTFADSALNIN